MRNSLGLLLRRGMVGAFPLVPLSVPRGPAATTPAPPGEPAAAEAENPTFTQRYRAPGHGGIVRDMEFPERTAGEFPEVTAGRVGPVAHDGDRGRTGDSLTASDGHAGDRLDFRPVSRRGSARTGALSVALDAKP